MGSIKLVIESHDLPSLEADEQAADVCAVPGFSFGKRLMAGRPDCECAEQCDPLILFIVHKFSQIISTN